MRHRLVIRAVAVMAGLAGVVTFAAPPHPPPNCTWHDLAAWDVEGRPWADEPRMRHFDRFPAAAEATVPPRVWELSRDSAGMVARFRTDATTIRVRMKLLRPELALPHMPATGVSGLDLYARDEQGTWRWVAATKPDRQTIEGDLVSGLAPGAREYAAYLPLYNGVESLAIGLPEGSSCEPLASREKPIVFYGTSITQGGCASRPGLTHVAILGRRLDRHVVNLGFSASGRMDEAVGDLLTRIDASCFVIDCLPNMKAPLVRERCVPLVERLRAARPDVPIVLVEDCPNTSAWIRPDAYAVQANANNVALREAFDTLVARGVARLHYLPGADLLGADGEGTVDGGHPTDLGFLRHADAFEPVLRQALGLPAGP